MSHSCSLIHPLSPTSSFLPLLQPTNLSLTSPSLLPPSHFLSHPPSLFSSNSLFSTLSLIRRQHSGRIPIPSCPRTRTSLITTTTTTTQIDFTTRDGERCIVRSLFDWPRSLFDLMRTFFTCRAYCSGSQRVNEIVS